MSVSTNQGVATGTASSTGTVLAEKFIEGLWSKGHGEALIAAHRTVIERFSEYLSPRSASEGVAGDIEGFVGYLAQLGVTPGSIANYRKVLDRWVAFVEADRVRQAEAQPQEPVSDLLCEDMNASSFESIAPPQPRELEALMPELDSPPVPASFWDGATTPDTGATLMLRGVEAAPTHDNEATMMMRFAPPPVVPAPSVGDLAATMTFAAATEAQPLSDFGATMMVPAITLGTAEAGAAFAPAASAVVATEAGKSAAWTLSDQSEWQQQSTSQSDVRDLFDDQGPAPVKIIKTAPLPPSVPERAVTPAPRKKPVLKAENGAIPLAEVGMGEDLDSIVSVAESVVPAASFHGATHDRVETQNAWSLRAGGDTVHGLDLGEIRNRLRRGEVHGEDDVRRPGGDWMRVREYAPLRSILDEMRPGLPRRSAVPRTASFPIAGAMLGGACAAFLCGTLWWMVALMAEWDAPPLAILGGIMGATFGRRAAGGGLGRWTGFAGVMGATLTVAWQRYLVAQTVAVGAVSEAHLSPEPTVMTETESASLLFGCLLVGALAGWFLGRRSN